MFIDSRRHFVFGGTLIRLGRIILDVLSSLRNYLSSPVHNCGAVIIFQAALLCIAGVYKVCQHSQPVDFFITCVPKSESPVNFIFV